MRPNIINARNINEKIVARTLLINESTNLNGNNINDSVHLNAFFIIPFMIRNIIWYNLSRTS